MQGKITFTPQSPKAFLLSSKDKRINGNITLGGNLTFDLTQDYKFGEFGTTGLYIQGQTSNIDSFTGFFTKDGDGTDIVAVALYGVGAPGNITTRERLQFLYRATTNVFEIQSEAAGSGILRPLTIYTGTNSGQVIFNTDKTVTYGGKIISTVASGSPVLAFFPTGDAAPAGSTSGTIALQSGFSGFMEVQLGSGGTPAYIPYFVA